MITRIGFKVDKKGIEKGKKHLAGFKKAAKVAVVGIMAGLVAIGIGAVKAAADMEMLTTQFEVMLGSTEKANVMMEKLETFAATTPFQLQDLAQGSQQLLAFTVAEEDVISTMRMLGDAAGGNREKLAGLVLAYGKVQAKGKASLEEINMITEKGVPIMATLMKQLNLTEDQFFKMVSAGKIGRKDITQAFKTMTSEGGMFYQGMLKQSKTFSGVMSTLKDVIGLVLATIGKEMLPVLKEYAAKIIDISLKVREWVKLNKEGIAAGFKKLIKIIVTVAKILFKFGAVLLWIATSPIGAMILGIVVALKTYAIVMGIVNTIQAIWNALLIANPIGIIIVAIGALVGAIIWLALNWKKVVAFFKKGIEFIVVVFKKGVAMIKVFFSNLWAFLKKWGAVILTIFAPMIGIPLLIIKNWSKIINFFRNFRGNMTEIITSIKNALLSAFTDPIGTIKKIWNGLMNFFKGIFNSIVDVFNSMIKASNKIPFTKKIKEFEKMKKASEISAEKTAAAGPKTINANMQNKIGVNVQGGAGGATGKAIGAAVANGMKSVFALQLKKIAIASG